MADIQSQLARQRVGPDIKELVMTGKSAAKFHTSKAANSRAHLKDVKPQTSSQQSRSNSSEPGTNFLESSFQSTEQQSLNSENTE